MSKAAVAPVATEGRRKQDAQDPASEARQRSRRAIDDLTNQDRQGDICRSDVAGISPMRPDLP
jgi:hypothetical protein